MLLMLELRVQEKRGPKYQMEEPSLIRMSRTILTVA